MIIIHELGHFLAAKLMNVETDKIYLYPLGGISKINMPLNISIKKEFIILIMGPLFQNVAYILLLLLLNDYEFITRYHIGILVFNLLPIYPLDGGKLINLFFTCIIPYKLSYKLIIIISYIINILLLFSNNKISINMILTYIVLIIIIRREEVKEELIYNKFLLERYLYNYSFRRNKIINNTNSFYRIKNNIIKKYNIYYDEKQLLSKKYQYFKKKY